jgi:hypothetical protein
MGAGHHDKFLPKHYSIDLARIIDQMLQVNAVERPTASELLLHSYFDASLKVMQAIKASAPTCLARPVHRSVA